MVILYRHNRDEGLDRSVAGSFPQLKKQCIYGIEGTTMRVGNYHFVQ